MVVAVAPTASSGERPASSPVVSVVPVRFEVVNQNRSAVACESDRQEYTLRARLAVPARSTSLPHGRAVTLYVHGLGLSSYYWHFQADPGYDHLTEMARRGHVGVVYDRLGYGENPKPLGLQTCYGSDADIASQLVTKLKSGDYSVEGRQPIAFDRVVVASHSQAGLIVQPMAYSFDVADGLVITSWTDDQNHPHVAAEAVPTAQTCLTGGESSPSEDRPPFYAYYPEEEESFERFYFHNAEPRVVAAAVGMREPDPCGQGGSLLQTLLADRLHLAEIDVPVLLAYGSADGYRPQPAAGQAHAEKFTGSDDVTLELLDDTGNALVLERTAPQFRDLLSDWLCARRFAESTACPRRPSANAPRAGVEATASSEWAGPAGEVLPTTGPRMPLLVAGSGLLALGVLAGIGREASRR